MQTPRNRRCTRNAPDGPQVDMSHVPSSLRVQTPEQVGGCPWGNGGTHSSTSTNADGSVAWQFDARRKLGNTLASAMN